MTDKEGMSPSSSSSSHRGVFVVRGLFSIPHPLYLFLLLSFSFNLGIDAQPQTPFFGSRLPNEVNYDLIQVEPTYFVLASKTIRPGQVYRVIATVYRSNLPITVRAAIQRNGVELASASQECKARIPESLSLRVPSTSLPGHYRLRVEGNLNGVLGGTAFLNETSLEFSQRSMTIFITTDKPVYMQGQIVRFRCVPVTTDLKAFTDAVDVYMLDPKGNVMRRWLSRQSNFGAVSLEYPLSQQPVFGNWTIKVIAQGQEESKEFLVEEYYQTRFEVNVSMPTFFLDTEKYIKGSIMANFTSGIPVTGNLTILLTIEPTVKSFGRILDTYPAIEHHIKLFEGYTEFRFEMSALSKLIGGTSLDGAKVTVKAYVGERFLNLIYYGYARAFIFGSRLKLKFLGSSPQVFRPAMPFKAYCALSYHDGSPLDFDDPRNSKYLDIAPRVFFSGRQQTLPIQREAMNPIFPGIWEVSVDLTQHFKDKRILTDVQKLRLEATYIDQIGDRIPANLDVYAYYSMTNRMIQVSTSTKQPRVGEYVIFHVRANYFVDSFSWAVISKGMILVTGTEEMTSTIKTFAVSLSPEMAPSSTIVVYDIARGGDVTVDALTFPVDGISRNNFTVTLNNRKDKSGDTIEVVVLGQPGSYIGLSALDKDLHALDAGNQINHADVLKKMSTFDTDSNGTLTHVWVSREGALEQFLHFASPSYGIDANRTFDYAGLVVFTDGNITHRREMCNASLGFVSCFDGKQCYHLSRKCDLRVDCSDGSDESNCEKADPYNLANFRLYRTNRLQRLYENSWMWKDINIGPLGYYIVNALVPNSPASWTVTAFGMSVSHGFGLQSANIQFSSVRPFYANVEMPSKCTLGEQIGVRISVFNNMNFEIEVVVVLARSPDYKFVHVGPFGVVSSYEPHTSFGEHHHLVVIRPGRSSVVYMPIVAQRLGHINVTVTARTMVARDVVTKDLFVMPDGIPQHVHTSAVLDLSQGAYLIKYLDTNITDTPIIPFREERRYIFGSNKAVISVVGDVVGPAFPTIPVNASSLLRKPFDGGEQNMFNFAFNMYTLFYMRMTGQRLVAVEREAFKYLNIQYQRQLSYQNKDGSFRAFRWNPKSSSVWLTAFCARILYKATFQEWENFLYIDPQVITQAVAFILQHQTPDGAFYETSIQPYDRKMNLTSKSSADHVRFRNISLTAHVLITLMEVKDLRGEISGRVSTARWSAQRYLERMLHVVKSYEDPYELSIVTYALTLANSVDAEEAFNLLDAKMKEVSGMRYWSKEHVPPPKTQIENNRPYLLPRLPDTFESLNVETTAYALLTHLSKQALIQKEIVEWLNSHRLHTGGWSSTQDSIVAFQALIEYSIQSRLRDVTDIDVTIEVPSNIGFEKKIHIGQSNLAQLQAFDIENAYGPVIVKAQGSGLAIIQLDVEYNVDWPHLQIQPPVRAFDLSVQLKAYGRNSSHLEFRSCQRWVLSSEGYSSGMAVLEVTIPTGYLIQQQELDSYVKSGSVRNLQEARYQERKVTFYFDFLDVAPICVSFTVQRWYPVANLTRYMPVRVYDFYAPERFNETMLNTYNLYVLSVCHVCGSYQCPYCPIFSGGNLPTPSYPAVVLIVMFALLSTWKSGKSLLT